ncbi:microtubule-associated protein 1-like protein [Carex littledalei]|uniref:Microtubule-associated protein 1-like protein n=1 Tax=Carex littledalei TaxID=544730 RepID=A0A833R7N7_9POAL|nr:microtubule-associated protein 1-like protein [Carex littledalei]
MAVTSTENPSFGENTCGSLLQQLQRIWNEVGESDEDRDKILLQLDQECLDVYKRKVDMASQSRDLLIQALDDSKIELARLLSALGEKTIVRTPEKSSGTIKEQLAAIAPTLNQLNKQKEERVKEFVDVQSQIEKICGEIAGTLEVGDEVGPPEVDEDDLSLEKLEDFRAQLQELQKEKSNRQQKVLDYVSVVHDLCTVLGMDFFSTITEVHPSLDDSIDVNCKSISDDTLSKLDKTVVSLKEDKKTRLHKLQELAMQLSDLWNLMETPKEERSFFDHVTCHMSATVDEVTDDRALALDLIEQAEVEVERLDQLKSSKMKEIALKKQTELEEIFASAHVVIDTKTLREKLMVLIEAGSIEPSELIADMDNQILKAKEESFSRKDILDKVERWMSACDEESWLEDYNQDENRYSSSRGAHLNLKRAEKARILVNKIPALVDTLVAKTRAWEEDRGSSFMYDGVPLLAMLDEYLMLRLEREEEKRRLRDQKKYVSEVVVNDHSPNKPLSSKKVVGPKSNGTASAGPANRRLSVNGANGVRSAAKDRRESLKSPTASNTVSVADAASCVSGTEPIPNSP